jgi:hypothetical protein
VDFIINLRTIEPHNDRVHGLQDPGECRRKALHSHQPGLIHPLSLVRSFCLEERLIWQSEVLAKTPACKCTVDENFILRYGWKIKR